MIKIYMLILCVCFRRYNIATNTYTYNYIYQDFLWSEKLTTNKYLWISWSNGLLLVGRGNKPGIDTVAFFEDPYPFSIKSMSVFGYSSGEELLTWIFPEELYWKGEMALKYACSHMITAVHKLHALVTEFYEPTDV
jgi:hypothetical protein